MHDFSMMYILFVGVAVFIAHLFAIIFEKFHIPDVLLLMLSGIIVGPILGVVLPGFLGPIGELLTIVALILILFEGGLDLRFLEIRRVFWTSIVITFTTFLSTVAAVSSLLHYRFGFDWITGVVVGVALGGISPAIVIPVVRSLGLKSITRTLMSIESAMADVSSLVIAVGIVESYKNGATMFTISMFTSLVIAFLISFFIGLTGAVVWAKLLDKVRKIPNTIFTTFGFLFIIYAIAESTGGNGPVTAFVFGIFLSNLRTISYKYRHIFSAVFSFDTPSEIEKSFYGEVIFLLKAFFFFYLGVSFNYATSEALYTSLVIVSSIVILRFVIVLMVAPDRILFRHDAVVMSVLSPKGLPAVVIGTLVYESGMPHSLVAQDIIYMSVVISIVINSILIFLVNKKVGFSIVSKLFRRFKKDKGCRF